MAGRRAGGGNGAARASQDLPACCGRGCTSRAVSRRAKFCVECFVENARAASYKRKTFGGNTDAKGVLGNRGNTRPRASASVGTEAIRVASACVGIEAIRVARASGIIIA